MKSLLQEETGNALELAKKSETAEEAEKLETDLREMLVRLSNAFSKKGVHVAPFTPNAWKNFQAFPLKRKKQVYGNVSHYFDIYMPVLELPGSPNEDGRLLWAAVKKLRLRPCSDLFNNIEEEDIVEFYAPTGVHLFLNINFFEVCSYTFLEIFSYPYTELWTRNQKAFEDAKQVVVDGFTGKFKSTVDANIPQQFLIESFSEEHYIIQLDFTKFSPLYTSGGEVGALAVVSRGKLIDAAAYSKILKRYAAGPRPLHDVAPPELTL